MSQKTYSDIASLYREVVGHIVIDLVPYAMDLSEDLQSALKEPVDGLYLPGSVEPLFVSGENYLVCSKRKFYPVTYQDIVSHVVKTWETGSTQRTLLQGDLYNESGNLVIRRPLFERVAGRLKFGPTVPLAGCEMVIAVALDYLNTLSPYTSVALRHYRLPLLVKEERQELLEKQSYETALDDMILEIMKFVGRDTWSLYSYRVVGTTLLIDKGLDFRIFDWHRREIEESEHFDHDLGGIPNGYVEHTPRARKKRR